VVIAGNIDIRVDKTAPAEKVGRSNIMISGVTTGVTRIISNSAFPEYARPRPEEENSFN
jgi:hypothetical protein